MSRRLQLDRAHLIQMLRDPEFYTAVPALGYLAEAGVESWRLYIENRDCRRCGDGFKYMKGVVDAFFIKLMEFKTNDPASIDQIRAYLTKKKGYPVQRIVLYYRRSRRQGKIAKLVL